MEKLNDIAKGVKPEWQKTYREVIEKMAFDLTKNIGQDDLNLDAQEQPRDTLEQNGILARFRKLIGRKMMMFISMGLLNLSGPLKESQADQLKIILQEDRSSEFFIEEGIAEEELESFEEKLGAEEPEFLNWLRNYEIDLMAQLYKLPENIFTSLESRKMDKSQEVSLFAAAEERYGSPMSDEISQKLQKLISDSHLIKKQMIKAQESIRNACKLLADHIHTVLLSSIFMENSREVREEMLKSHNAPLISFALHSPLDLEGRGVAFTLPVARKLTERAKVEEAGIELPDKWQPEVLLTPFAFGRKPEQKIGIDNFLGVLIHELGHGLRQGPIKLNSLRHSNLFRMLNEGVVENYTSETLRLLGHKDDRFRSMIGYEPDYDYDHRLILAVVLKSMTELGKEKDLLSKWHMQLISDDEFLRKLRDNIRSIKVDEKIIEDIEQFEKNPDEKETFSSEGVISDVIPSARLLYAILARLNMSQVELSPAFIKKIMLNGLVDDWQVENVERLIKVLPDFIEQKSRRLQTQ